MSITIVSSTMTIMESTMTIPIMVHTEKPRHDRPLSCAEAEALEELKCEVQGWFPQGTHDYFLLRFLRARALHLGKAKEMLAKYIEFRKTNHYLAEICKKSYVPSEFILQQIPFVRTGNDFDGRPVFVVQVGHADLKRLFEQGEKEEMLKLGHYGLEFLLYATEKQRKKYGCTKAVGIADLSGISFRNAFHSQTIQCGIYAARIFEAFYPELLHLAIGINANWIFHSVYNMMKPFVSAETLEKVQIYGYDQNKWKPVLRKYIPIDAIPEEYGGTAPSMEHANVDTFEGFRAKL